MDKVAELQDTDISKILFPTIGHFIPVLEEKRSLILSTPRRTFKYGETDRHKLDVYYPSEPSLHGETPILFFSYGGGYTSGGKTMPPPADLVCANIGAYFAQRGFITIIPDYRLMPVTYPMPSLDVRDAIVWILENPHSLSNGNIADADPTSLFFMGHSVGAVNFATMLLLSLLPEDVQRKCKGVILISGGYTCDNEAVGPTFNPEVATQFFGSLEKAKENTPLSLLNKLPKDKLATLPELCLVEAEREPEPFKLAGKQFHEALSSLTGKHVPKVIGQGHNHISITLALMSGQGEQWAEEVFNWMQAAL
ncbi:alpha/beta hydrolase domain-containing protein [Gymnopus androsaceus JB14]|uniref:Alpha/beta hydrolase domain-containing protein n=1 Tax=Gymnopus androsaceus JB14 TaxID=1447944 RepID=A0A6A4HFM5_9AGAR|nr:alpha/beta hydrolase domain-containing protein [Gymnopus androsaceus JB14]